MGRRAHTGRRRNEAARQAILAAAAELLAAGCGADVAVAAIAERAGVGKQTIYRWWPSKSAVMLEAMVAQAKLVVPDPDSGELAVDLRALLQATFAAVPTNRALLLGALRQALASPPAMTQLAALSASRREALAVIIKRARARGEISDTTQTSLLVDQAFGLLGRQYATEVERGILVRSIIAP